MWHIIAAVVILAVGFVSGLLVGRKNPKLADNVHDEGKEIIQDIKRKT